jgi:hypothetical protein
VERLHSWTAFFARSKRREAVTSNGTRSLWAIITVAVVIGFVASLPGRASVGPIAPVVVSDVKSVAGAWQGAAYEPGSEPDYVELTIDEIIQ